MEIVKRKCYNSVACKLSFIRSLNMRYVIIGNYGSTNIGDEAILAAIVDRLRLRDKSSHITVLSYNPQTTERIHNVKAQVLFPLCESLPLRFFELCN